MAPSLIKSQSRMLVIGSSGGRTITTGLASVRIQGIQAANARSGEHLYWGSQVSNCGVLQFQASALFLFQALMNHLWFGKSLKAAIAEPVVFVDSSTNLTFEEKFDQVKIHRVIQ